MPLIIIAWLGIISLSLGWNVYSARQEQLNLANESTRSFFNQIVITRLWNARHGGVYIKVTDKVKPNKYLRHPRRDIFVDEELSLTLINPAYMTRQIADRRCYYQSGCGHQ